MSRRNTADDIWAKVDKTDTCWLWTGHINTSGYGQIRWGGPKARAHRIAYELEVGPIPEGLELDHLCRVRHCVNPSHLEPVTRRVNVHRGEGGAGRNSRKTHCPRGHAYDYAVGGRRYCRTCRAVYDRARRAH